MAKFNVWDRVRIKEGLNTEYWRDEYTKWVWKIVTIKSVSFTCYYLEECWAPWKEEEFELVEPAFLPWDLVGVSDISQKDTDNDFRNNVNRYYIWKTKRGEYAVECTDGYPEKWKFISKTAPKEPEIKEMTLEEICKELKREVKIVKS